MEVNKKVEEWYADNVVEDVEDIIRIAESSITECRRRWNIGFDTVETVIATYSTIYNCVLAKLKAQRDEKTQYAINIADFVEIGYDDAEDDGITEKVGNFCPYIADLGKKIQSSENPDLTTIERCTEWTADNIAKSQQPKTLNEIATNAVKALHDIDIELASSTVIFPIFCTIHEQLVGYMRIKLADTDSSEVMINFANNFDIYCRKVESGDIVIEYSPKPIQKLDIKSDATATAPYEE